jgi:hypothetical protein
LIKKLSNSISNYEAFKDRKKHFDGKKMAMNFEKKEKQ